MHQQNTIKHMFKLHPSKFTLLLFQHNVFRVKSWKSGVIRSFHMKLRKKTRKNQDYQEVLDELYRLALKLSRRTTHDWQQWLTIHRNRSSEWFRWHIIDKCIYFTNAQYHKEFFFFWMLLNMDKPFLTIFFSQTQELKHN